MPTFTVMFVSDICGKPGRQAAAHLIKPMRQKHNVDYVVANVENAAGGFGITPEMSRKSFAYGIDLQTSGNHIWDRYEIIAYLKGNTKLLRPANFPGGVPGKGVYVEQVGDVRVGVINVQGRTYMKDIDCPFMVARKHVLGLRKETDIILVDFHAEATSEKQAMLYYLDGEVTAIVGTHTHVQTADEQISDKGTAYITDIGMTGAYDSVIGMEKEPSLQRFLTGMPRRFTSATGDVRMSGVLVEIDPSTGKALKIERYCTPFDIETFKPWHITGIMPEEPGESEGLEESGEKTATIQTEQKDDNSAIEKQ